MPDDVGTPIYDQLCGEMLCDPFASVQLDQPGTWTPDPRGRVEYAGFVDWPATVTR